MSDGPPSGWYAFGTHAGWDSKDIPPLEFSEEVDEAGMPLFERPNFSPRRFARGGMITPFDEGNDSIGPFLLAPGESWVPAKVSKRWPSSLLDKLNERNTRARER